MAVVIGGAIAAALGLTGVGGYLAWSRRIDPNSPYDVVIDIASLRNFSTKGWPIELRSEPVGQDPSSSEQIELTTRNLVAVLGQYNQGKTWFLSALAGENFAAGYMTKTKGLSVKTPLGKLSRNFVILDTEGSDSCVSYEEFPDRRATESFLRELVLKLATVVIVVVNRLRRSDQSYLMSLIRNLNEQQKSTGSFKPLFVLHNFKDTTTLEDTQTLIDEEIIGVFDAKRQFMSVDGGKTENYYWHSTIQFDNLEKKNIPVQHFVVASSSSSAGKHWNAPTFEIIRRLVESSPTRRAYNLLQEVNTFATQRLPAYVRVPPGQSLVVSLDKQNALFCVSLESVTESARPESSSSSSSGSSLTEPVVPESSSSSSSGSSQTEPIIPKPSSSSSSGSSQTEPIIPKPSASPSSSSIQTFFSRIFRREPPPSQLEHPADPIPPPQLLPYKLDLLDLSYDEAGCITNVVSPQGIIPPPYNVVEFPEHYDIHVDLAGTVLGDVFRAPNGRSMTLRTKRSIPPDYQPKANARYLRQDIHFGELGVIIPFSSEIEGAVEIAQDQGLFFLRYHKKDMSTPRHENVQIKNLRS